MTGIPTNYSYNLDSLKYKYLERLDKSPEIPDMHAIKTADKFMLRRSRLSHKETTKDKLQSFVGATLGTVAMMALLMKRQKIKNPLKLEYGLGEMLALSAAPIMTGVGAGMIGNDAKSNLAKSREGVFQFLNAAIPTWLAASTLKWCETTKGMNNAPVKLLSTAATILIGMHGAASLSNIICDPKDNYPDRKLNLLDSIANVDDLFGVLVLAKVPIVSKFHLDKLLPAIYTFCGYRAGKSN